MKTIAYNDRQLETIITDIYDQFNKNKSLQIEYRKPYKDKSVRQLGYIFGGLVDSVIEFYEYFGTKWNEEDVMDNFYNGAAYLDDRLIRKINRFNGEQYEAPKRLSSMDMEEASIFIDKCLLLIDNAKCFQGLTLRPELRYTWIRHIKKDDIDQLRFAKFPRNDKEYLEHIRKQHCIWCGKNNGIEAHHLKIAGESGTAYKADDWLALPLCTSCHREYHQKGQEAFNQALSWITKYISLTDFCKINYLKWRNHK